MTTYAEDLAEIAGRLEAAAAEAAKRRALRAGQGRDLPPETRAQLERCQLALAVLLAPIVPQASVRDRLAAIDAEMERYTGRPGLQPLRVEPDAEPTRP
jgi:hypothetical protein